MAESNAPLTLGEKMQALPKWFLYLLLMVVCSVPLVVGDVKPELLKVPNKPVESSIDFYSSLMTLKPGCTVLLESDWTNSTRGESGGQFDATVRILMRRGVKIALYSGGDPQAPQVALDEIAKINEERKAKNEHVYERWTDYVNLGFFPNLEGTANAMGGSVRKAFGGKKDVKPGVGNTDVFKSPVLENVRKLNDVPMLVVLTASKTSTILIERLYGKVPLLYAVTGVMGPETQVYYSSGQLVGLLNGLKGVYDVETMMESGVNKPGPDGKIVVESEKHRQDDLPGFPGDVNAGKGTAYYPTLHFALGLLILAVVVGNVGMVLAKRGNR